MRVGVLRFLRVVLVLALVGVGPGTRMADLLLFHGPGSPAVAASQVDDGTIPLPHADGCTLATPSAPVVPSVACGAELAVGPDATDRPFVPAVRVPETQSGRSPPSRAPPTLLS